MINNKNFTDIFKITNLHQLSGEFRLYEIEGLDIESDNFQRNKQFLIRNLSRALKHPIEIIKKGKTVYLVSKNEESILKRLPDEYSVLQKQTVYFKKTDEIFPLDFNSDNPMDRIVCKRFLQFSIQGTIFKSKKVWQPTTGKPFFSKKPIPKRGVDIFPGFVIRIVDLKKDGWGISIDATRKYIDGTPLPDYVSKQEFDRKYKNRKVVVKLGHDWYEVKLTQWHSLNVSKHKYPNPNGEGNITLIEDLRTRYSKPHPLLLANLPADASVVFYHLSNGEARSVPSGLCFLVLGTEDEMDGHLHQNSILNPDVRLDEMDEVRNSIVNNLTFGGIPIKLSNHLRAIPKQKFTYADIEIGNGEILKFEEVNFRPREFAKQRAEQIFDGSKSGFLKPVQSTLGPQYFFLPRSVFDTVKDDFMARVTNAVNKMYPWYKYEPKVEFFEDIHSKRMNYVRLGKKIISDISKKVNSEILSHAVVMIPSIGKGKREHDKLGALVIRELKKLNISATIIHSDTVLESYNEYQDENGDTIYQVKSSMRGKFNGYAKNVALVKVLLNNRKYPFALATPLNADLTIGIDVKNNLAGFVFIDKYAKVIHPEFVDTSQKEKLTTRIIAKVLYDAIKLEASNSELKNIVIQRDGRIYDTELKGAKLAIKKLKDENILSQDATLSIITIPKNSFISYRMYSNLSNQRIKGNQLNPEIGSWDILNNEIGYVCTTGKEFLRKGTAKPLMVNYVSGNMNFVDILQDIFYLSNLTFTKLDDCSRLPFSIKILDLMLRGLASEYDKQKLEYLDFEDDEELETLLQNELNSENYE